MAITLSLDGYCELADVQAVLQQFTIDTNSDPSDTEVEAFISQDFGEINAVLRGAGYAAPVAQAGGSLTAAAITVADAATAGSWSVTLTGSGLAGSAKKGDFFTIGSDPQPYMVNQSALTNSSNSEISVYIAPRLELDAAAGAAVTYTAAADGAKVLKKLNAYMSAIQTMNAAYSSSAEGVGELTAPLADGRDLIMNGIKSGNYDLPTIAVIDPHSMSISNVRLVRA